MTTTMHDNDQRLLRLLQLVSPSLPTGAFAYSQGLEWTVEAGWIDGGPGLRAWLADLLDGSLAMVDIPLLVRMTAACRSGDDAALGKWADWLTACRESDELRQEEQNRGRAMAMLLKPLRVPLARRWQQTLCRTQLAGFALAASAWSISDADAARGYAWAWLENQVIAGIKIIPLGQSEGQGILFELAEAVMAAVKKGVSLDDGQIGSSCPALAVASSRHETQYTRLYRS